LGKSHRILLNYTEQAKGKHHQEKANLDEKYPYH